MADLRLLRDSALFVEGETDARCPEETPACDLNADGEALRDRATEINPRALITLLESLSLWYGCPLHAVLDADAEDVRRYPE
jgi:hypothetical protein